LITPDGKPVGDPKDSGDGQNEFTFDESVKGVLRMEPKAVVAPSGIAAQVADQCLFTVGAIGASVMAWDTANPGGKSKASGDNLLAKVTFTGLPVENDSFGTKKAAIYDADGCKLDEKIYEVFFTKDAKNHPGTGSGTTPNWFYYWAGTAVPGYDLVNYNYGGYKPFQSGEYNDDVSNPKYTLFDNAAGAAQYNSPGLSIDIKGVDTCAAVVQHEKTHYYIAVMWRPPNGPWKNEPDSDLPDADGIPDTVENTLAATYGLDPTKTRSLPNFPIDGTDAEVYCEISASKSAVSVHSKDWANPGKQSKNQF
jgi:hypothetical protein